MIKRHTFQIFKTPLPPGSPQMTKSMAAEATILDALNLLDSLALGHTYDETTKEAEALVAALKAYLRASGEVF